MTKNKHWIILFLLPGLLLFAFVFLGSIIMLVTTSFTNWRIGSDITFNGIGNYIYLFTQDEGFISSVWHTIAWILLQATVHVFIGVLVALVIAGNKWYLKAVRTIFFIPNVISSAALGMLFLMIMNPQFGLVNNMLSKIVGDSFTKNWFMDPQTAFLTVTLTWLPYAGLVTILFIAELTSIPTEIYEAAEIDGASTLQKNIYIVLPLMKNIIGTAVILSATSMLQKLDIIMMTTGGGPGYRTMNLPMYLYRTLFTDNNYGLANTQGVILSVIGILSILLIRLIFKMDQEES